MDKTNDELRIEITFLQKTNSELQSKIDILEQQSKELKNIIGHALDITEKKNAETQLKESEKRYRLLTENISDVIWILNVPLQKFTYISPSVYQLRGFTDLEAMEQNITESLTPESAQMVLKNIPIRIRNFQNGIRDTYIDQIQQPCKDKSIKWIETATKYQYGTDGTIEVLGISRDISERKKIEQDLKELNASKDKFFSIIAHDLKGPFIGFLGLTEIMQSTPLTPEEIRNMGNLMHKSADNLFKLLENLLTWARMQRNMIEFNPKLLVLSILVTQNLIELSEMAKQKNIELIHQVPNTIKILADSSMINTVFRNLISNAIKFTKRGGKVIISAEEKEKEILVSVKDSGIGMNETILGGIFRIDQKTSRPGTEKESSTGLGLILCKDFVEKHNGKIWAESEEDKGSIFYFTLREGEVT